MIVTFPSDDPEWEVRFIEGMSQARFRCTYLNAESWGVLPGGSSRTAG